MEKAGASLESQDEFDQPSTSRGSGKKENVNQNVTPATSYNTENVSSNAAAADFDAEDSRELTGEELHALCDRRDYFAHYPDNIKEKAKQILNEKYESEQQQVLDLFQSLKIKPRFQELPAPTTTDECLVSVEMDCDCEFYEFYIVGPKSEIHAEILDYFRNVLT